MPAAAPYGLALGGSILAVWGAMRAGKLSRRLRDAEAALEVEMMTHRELRRTIADQSQRPMIIMDSEPECVKVQAADGTILDMNPAGLAIIDAKCREDIVGKAAYGYIAREYRDKYAEMKRRVFAGEAATLEFRLIGLKGRQRWMESHAVTPARARRRRFSNARHYAGCDRPQAGRRVAAPAPCRSNSYASDALHGRDGRRRSLMN
jgi:PAS domain-containing protein